MNEPNGEASDEPNGEASDGPIAVDRAFVCERCDTRWYYDRSRCADCGCRTVSTDELERGVLVAKTTVETTPPDVRSPNHLGIARFGDVQLIAQLADDAVVAGDPVEFAGEYRLRDGDDDSAPRLRRVETERSGR
ncbi:hypothetical protein [Halorubrum sp. DTA98]|uniref:hypothetical protein n=1 Tax=Halorubrum sp. DTA98 TaxID=3402163 RepID=UPI003AAD648E